MTEHYDCPSCEQPITDDRWIQVDVRGGADAGVSFVSRDRYHLDCWIVMTDRVNIGSD
jgi:hypothetical protein